MTQALTLGVKWLKVTKPHCMTRGLTLGVNGFKIGTFVPLDTCRCPVRLLANWLQAPPLYFKARATNVTSPIGLLPARLQHVIDHVCGTCHGHKRTEVVYRQQNNSLQALTSSMTAHVQLYLPISMVPRMPFEMPEWAFLPMVEVAGLAVITRKISTEVYSSKLGSSLLERWPVFVVLFVLYVTIGIVVWTLVSFTRRNIQLLYQT